MTSRLPAGQASVAEQFGYQRGWLVGNLPMVMQEDGLTARFVTIIEEIASSVRFSVESSADAADLSITTPAMVHYLGEWLATPGGNRDLDGHTQRAIVQADSETVRARGTASALQELLESVTGGQAWISDPGGTYREGAALRVERSVRVDLEQRGHLGDADLIELIRAETPAHLPVTIYVAGLLITAADPSPERALV